MVIICNGEFNNTNIEYKKYFDYFSFPLSNFQKWAIYSIVSNNNCLITAHTGSGKTLPAEFAIQYFKKQGKKVIYTGPIKALCNQKLYDFRNKYKNISFGILTGDIKDNPEADVLIMTTEILRNTLFSKQIFNKKNTDNTDNTDNSKILSFEMDFDTELAAVIFDEVHYIGDESRGSVWEQSILMLPNHVQQIMLSATIDKAENFASWVEKQKIKDVYLCSTYDRVVPLTHYMWLTLHQSALKQSKGTEYEQKIKYFTNKPIVISNSNGKYIEENYYKINELLNYIETNKYFIKRSFILNGLIKYLLRETMLPAICFIFSRKNVELCAKEITFSLFEPEDKTPTLIEKECIHILMKKLPNYKEYIQLPEYIELIELLKKGIAIHHAGIMPILREMVELLFEKNYIKLLFATETFAVGINMPTKTVIFTSLSKFDGNNMRDLYPHEYTQMAGRAGRRGIDTVGNVIHCNNIFDIPRNITYKKILTGTPKMLISQFKISFNLILNIIYTNKDIKFNIKILKDFIEKSLMKDKIDSSIESYIDDEKTLERNLNDSLISLKNLRTSTEILERYYEKKYTTEISAFYSKKKKKELQREIQNIENENKSIETDIIKYINYKELQKEIKNTIDYKNNTINYIEDNIQTILNILINHEFISNNYNILDKGIVATQIQEIHCLVLADIYNYTNGFDDLNEIELAGLFSCFTNIKVSDDIKIFTPKSSNKILNNILIEIERFYKKYEKIQTESYLCTDCENIFHYDILEYIIKWCTCENENECKELIQNIKKEKNIFLGDFVKAILKINNIVSELEKICEILGNIKLLYKLQKIPTITLKYVATNQSLYI